MTADNVAHDVYGDSTLDWVVLISNNIINVQSEWLHHNLILTRIF